MPMTPAEKRAYDTERRRLSDQRKKDACLYRVAFWSSEENRANWLQMMQHLEAPFTVKVGRKRIVIEIGQNENT